MWKPRRFYAQNLEDFYLYRLFSSIENGFYVDAGAWHPRKDSVTAVFYDHGWSGINIEPVQEIFEILSSERPKDTNLCLSVADSMDNQSAPFLVAGSDPSAWGHHAFAFDIDTGPQNIPDKHAGTAAIRSVPVTTLREIIRTYGGGQKINFLKIDVEGAEYIALLGLDIPSLSPHQLPQVILLEATLPNTRLAAPHRQKCRDYLLSNKYEFLFHDGLNDYYCLSDLYETFAPLMLPPNIFDESSLVLVGSRLYDFMDFAANEKDNYLSQVDSLNRQIGVKSAELETSRKEAELSYQELKQQLTAKSAELETSRKEAELSYQELKQQLTAKSAELETSRKEAELSYQELKQQLTAKSAELETSRKEVELFSLQLHQVQEEMEYYYFQSRSKDELIQKHQVQQKRFKTIVSKLTESSATPN
ncbi:FkbM family methyltransferase [bacterium]|nr:FkbM family methyltransferase [bacterium]